MSRRKVSRLVRQAQRTTGIPVTVDELRLSAFLRVVVVMLMPKELLHLRGGHAVRTQLQIPPTRKSTRHGPRRYRDSEHQGGEQC